MGSSSCRIKYLQTLSPHWYCTRGSDSTLPGSIQKRLSSNGRGKPKRQVRFCRKRPHFPANSEFQPAVFSSCHLVGFCRRAGMTSFTLLNRTSMLSRACDHSAYFPRSSGTLHHICHTA